MTIFFLKSWGIFSLSILLTSWRFSLNNKNTDFIDVANADAKVSVDVQKNELKSDVSFYSVKSQVALNQSLNPDEVDFSSDQSLLDGNVKKTGGLVQDEWTMLAGSGGTPGTYTKVPLVNTSAP